MKKLFLTFAITIIFAACAGAQTTAFSYQGRLNNGGAAANGNYEMQFKLYDALSAGTQVGTTYTDSSVAVINGFFTSVLDFGAAPFSNGAARFLEISVRPSGSTDAFTVLGPRPQILSAPYAIQAKNAQTADTSVNAQKLGGIDASSYVTTTSIGNSFIKNDTALQTGNFNISGNGLIGGSVGIGVNPFSGVRLDVNGDTLIRTTGSGGNIQLGTPNTETGMSISRTNRADVRFDGTTLKLLVGAGTGIPTNQSGISINTAGNVGFGTTTPATRLTLNGGTTWTSNGWTASLNLQNGAALGWEANASGQRFGIGQSTGALYFFRTNSAFGNTASPANYDFGITDTGNLVQGQDKGGLVKAMIYVNQNGTIARCFNSQNNTSTGGCGFSVTIPSTGLYDVDFGFQIDNRFITTTEIGNSNTGGCTAGSVSLEGPPVGSAVRIRTLCSPDLRLRPFMIFIY